MPSVPLHNQLPRGTRVSIVLKQDQGTGRQVTGTVQDLLTRGNHPRGVKVRLADGRVGRVQKLVEAESERSDSQGSRIAHDGLGSSSYNNNNSNMNSGTNHNGGGFSNNPFRGTGNRYSDTSSSSMAGATPDDGQSSMRPPAQPKRPSGQRTASQEAQYAQWQGGSGPIPAYGQAYGQGQGQAYSGGYGTESDTGGIGSGTYALPTGRSHSVSQHHNAISSGVIAGGSSGSGIASFPLPGDLSTSQYPQMGGGGAAGGGRRREDDADEFKLAPDERGEQFETIQHHQSTHQASQADRDQEALRDEFPAVDGSLIAALYADMGDIGSVREVLQELNG